ncbi:hypothetical protein HDU97_009689 [Phlyctochytrium planicorne]|nr:hypothetical protein HDU97_009689 [Phlyctochytrium planicorne]
MSALDDIVTKLLKNAKSGGTSKLSDSDVEKYIADLIVKEANDAERKYAESGIDAYLGNSKRAPKPNTRFLATVVRSTDNHNKALLDQISQDAKERLKSLRNDRHGTAHGKHRSKNSKSQRETSPGRKKRHKEEYSENEEDVTPPIKKAKQNDEEEYSLQPVRQNNEEENSPQPKIRAAPRVRGRGNIGPVRLDKLFTEGYNPRLDIDNYDENSLQYYVDALDELQAGTEQTAKKKKKFKDQEKKGKKSKKAKKEKKDKKEKKEKREKKKRKSKKGQDSSDSSSSQSDHVISPSEPQNKLSANVSDKEETYGPVYSGPRLDLTGSCPW